MFVRVFCAPGKLADTVSFYETLTSTRLDMDMEIPEGGLHVVAVGPFLILELDQEKHALAVETTATVLTANLDETVARQLAEGAEVAQARWESPVGPGIRLRHPDCLPAEYVEHRPSPSDVSEPGPSFADA
ncbi:MAG: hypothetical protein DLM61_27185 [Pseudonocardiales bacterium]|nr:MAG: hypothetical protein DLM61_27185 [Pseudonocardiales bacterium]